MAQKVQIQLADDLDGGSVDATVTFTLDGRTVVGFGTGRGYPFAQFLTDTEQAGLAPDLLLSTWNLRPFREDSDFLVAALRAARAPQP